MLTPSKDFVLLTVEPTDPVTSPFIALEYFVPVRLTTDGFDDDRQVHVNPELETLGLDDF